MSKRLLDLEEQLATFKIKITCDSQCQTNEIISYQDEVILNF